MFSRSREERLVLSIDLGALTHLGSTDQRLQSYNVEMAEVIGGSFWKPYGQDTEAVLAQQAAIPTRHTPVGADSRLFEQRPPIDLSDCRLRALAGALGPAYVRVSGTWANTVYFHDSVDPPPTSPPAGFGGVLTREQWAGVIDFADAVDAKLVTSVSTGSGVRDESGRWTADQAQRLLVYTRSLGGEIAASEFMNEPTYAAMGGAPEGYDAGAYGRDITVFRSFLKRFSPETRFLGPGSVGEQPPFSMAGGMLRSEDLLAAAGRAFDTFSYHFYGAVSERGAAIAPEATTTSEAALTEQWLARTEATHSFYADLRDRFDPGMPMWVTETADAAAGGNPWASSFLDTFRYVEQLARLARLGVQVITHNTLASSDYGLLDEHTLTPRPNYWAALLWRRLIGTEVLDPGTRGTWNLHVFAHSLRTNPEGVVLVVVNTDRTSSQSISIPRESQRYTLTAKGLLETTIQLNGSSLELDADGGLPKLTGVRTPGGATSLPPTSITFFVVPPVARSRTRRDAATAAQTAA